ncbi:MAG: lytic transglycosylase domain-containing protein [Lysobacterales bacterium]|nr:MAG: lytic transglycosylase domain-containing protein [Xanthomonadales bacterium]
MFPSARTRQRWAKAFRRAPRAVQLTVLAAVFVALSLGVNWSYQVIRKPSELFFPISGSFYKDPAETWRAYGRLFERHSTPVMTPDLLAALAQVEGSGNPVVRTYWRFSLTNEPFEIFRPASSAVGMYQITDGTFAIARRYCIHRHRVVEDGPWYDFKSCWWNALYTRTVPSHAVEMTAAHLDRGVADMLGRYNGFRATLEQKQALATMMHLCGAGAAAEYARRGLTLTAGQRCGAHDARTYVARVASMQRRFKALAES